MTDHVLLRACADRVKAQILEGVQAIHAGEVLEAELHFSLAQQALRKMESMLETPPQKPPLRKLALVSAVRESTGDELEVWMERKHGEPGDGAA